MLLKSMPQGLEWIQNNSNKFFLRYTGTHGLLLLLFIHNVRFIHKTVVVVLKSSSLFHPRLLLSKYKKKIHWSNKDDVTQRKKHFTHIYISCCLLWLPSFVFPSINTIKTHPLYLMIWIKIKSGLMIPLFPNLSLSNHKKMNS